MPKKIRTAQAIWIEAEQRWRVKVQKDGVRRTFNSSTPGRRGKTEAEKKADDWLENQSDEIRLGDAWDAFYEYHKVNTSRDNYVKTENIGRLYVFTVLPRTKWLHKVTPADWQRVIDHVAELGLSKKTCKNVRGWIGTFLNYARRQRWEIDKLEKGDVHLPRHAPVKKKVILQPNDLKTLFTKDSVQRYGRDYPSFFIHAWRFIALTGLRRGELCGLRNTDICGRVLTVNRSINHFGEVTEGKTENAQRTFVLSQLALGVLADQRAMLAVHGIKSPWVFPDESGERLDSNHLFRKWSTYRDQHGIQTGLHELRHTWISVMKNGATEQQIKRAVGHAPDMDTFGIYGHDVDGELEEIADAVDREFSRLIQPAGAAQPPEKT